MAAKALTSMKSCSTEGTCNIDSFLSVLEDSYSEGVRRFFNECDKNVDHYVSADEFLECTEKSDPQKNSESNEQGEDHILRYDRMF